MELNTLRMPGGATSKSKAFRFVTLMTSLPAKRPRIVAKIWNRCRVCELFASIGYVNRRERHEHGSHLGWTSPSTDASLSTRGLSLAFAGGTRHRDGARLDVSAGLLVGI